MILEVEFSLLIFSLLCIRFFLHFFLSVTATSSRTGNGPLAQRITCSSFHLSVQPSPATAWIVHCLGKYALRVNFSLLNTLDLMK